LAFIFYRKYGSSYLKACLKSYVFYSASKSVYLYLQVIAIVFCGLLLLSAAKIAPHPYPVIATAARQSFLPVQFFKE